MLEHDARALLAEALDFFNDHPRFTLRRDRHRDSYELASRIEKCLSAHRDAVDPVKAEARDRWSASAFLRIDADEHMAARDEHGCWVRAWVRVEPASAGEIDPVVAERYRQAVATLRGFTRSVLLAYQQGGQSISQTADCFGIPTREVEQLVADALTSIARAIGQG